MSEQNPVTPVTEPVAEPTTALTTAPARAQSTAAARSAEPAAALPTLFDEAGVTVTRARIVVYGTPFPLKDGVSVRLFQDRPHVRFAIPILIAGLLLGAYGIYISSSPAMALAFMLVVVSYLTYRFQTMRHRVFVVRPASETEVLVNSDLAFAHRVKKALEMALAGVGSAADGHLASPVEGTEPRTGAKQ